MQKEIIIQYLEDIVNLETSKRKAENLYNRLLIDEKIFLYTHADHKRQYISSDDADRSVLYRGIRLSRLAVDKCKKKTKHCI